MSRLIINVENEYPRFHQLLIGKTTFGRSKENDIVVRPSSVSAFHAEILKGDDGVVRIEDLKSQNGTYVNGEKIKKAVLKDGDNIKMGAIRLVFEAPQDDTQGVKSLMRKSEIERNNLKLIENDTRMARFEMEKAFKQKKELGGELEHLIKKLETAKEELRKNRKESGELEKVIAEARDFEKKADQLEIEYNTRKDACEELSRKIVAGEKLYGELDLDNSIKQKEKLTKEIAELSADIEKKKADFQEKIEKSEAELEENRRKSKQAEAIFHEAKMVETGIGDKKAELEKRNKDCEELENKITDRKKSLEDYRTKITDAIAESEKLAGMIGRKEKTVAELDRKVAGSEEQIRSAGSKLSEVEAKIEAGRSEVEKSLKVKNSLDSESLSLNRIVSDKSIVLQRLKDRISTRGTVESACPPVRLVNPGMSSLVHYFHHGAGMPGEEKFEPVGPHALAACTRGSMHRDADSILSEGDPVILLLTGDTEKDRQNIASVAPGSMLLVCPAEGQFRQGFDMSLLADGVSGIVCTDNATARFLKQSESNLPFLHIPVPCPVDFPDWDFSQPTSEGTGGVFVSGDGFDPNSPVHGKRLELIEKFAKQTRSFVTLFAEDRDRLRGLSIPGELVRKPEFSSSYTDYLKLVGKHRFVSGFGKNFAGADIIGDAVLTRTVFIGADAEDTVEQLLFPDCSIAAGNIDKALEDTLKLHSDRNAWLESMERSQSMAAQLISFESVSDQLAGFIQSLPAK